MELTEYAVARPDELVIFTDFQSRYKDWIASIRPESPEERVDWEPKRRGFVGVCFMRKDKNGLLYFDAELVPPDDIINHCRMIRTCPGKAV